MSWIGIRRFPLCMVLLAGLGVAGGTVSFAAEDNTEIRKVTVHAAAEPIPALKYQLLPGLMERTPGNGAVLYNRLLLRMETRVQDETWEKIESWQGSNQELPADEVRSVLESVQSILSEVKVAARRETCQWDIPFQEWQNPFAVELPELQRLRRLARILVLETRLAIQEERIDDAIETLQTGFAFARDVGNGPTLIHGLVGISISSIFMEQVEVLSQRADAPSLYWALAAMPRPLIDLRRGLETEMHVLDLWMPDLSDCDTVGDDPAFWEARLKDVAEGIRDINPDAPQAGYRPLLTLLALKGYPKAVEYMISKGHSREEVESMHVARVLLTATIEKYRRDRDAAFKWYFLPFDEARQGVSDWEAQLRGDRASEVFPLASVILPAIGGAKAAEARHHRSIEVARLIEAVRLHAAAKGNLPTKAEEITEVPVPEDPIWGRPFTLTRNGEVLVIESEPMSYRGRSGEYGLRVEVRLAK